MDQTQNAHRQNSSDMATVRIANQQMKSLFPTDDFYGSGHRRAHYHEPLEHVDSYSDIKAKF